MPLPFCLWRERGEGAVPPELAAKETGGGLLPLSRFLLARARRGGLPKTVMGKAHRNETLGALQLFFRGRAPVRIRSNGMRMGEK